MRDNPSTLKIISMAGMVRLTKEDRLAIRSKMDAVSLQGVWLGFPESGTVTGRSRAVAGLYRQLLQQEFERRKREGIPLSRKQVRAQLLEEVEKRIVQRNNDDIVSVLLL